MLAAMSWRASVCAAVLVTLPAHALGRRATPEAPPAAVATLHESDVGGPVTDDAPDESTADEPGPDDPADLEARAQAAFAAGRYDEVVELAARAYELTGDVRHLYAQAHAERFRGDCKEALALYARVMAADPDGMFGQHAREGIKLCEQELQHPPPPQVVHTPPPPSRPTPAPADVRLQPDPLGGVLLGIGVASLATAGGLAVLASTHAHRLDRANDEQTIVNEQRRARGFEAAAIATSVVATSLIVGGIVRLVQQARQSRTRRKSARR